MLPHRYRVVKYDAARRSGEVDDWICHADIGSSFDGVVLTEAEYLRVEQAHLDTVRAAAAVSGVDSFEVREPNNGDSPEFHDGAVVGVDAALEILRAMLRETGPWCRLEAPGRMYVHVSWDYYLFVGSCVPCAQTLAARGLYVDEMTSPLDVEADVQVEYRPADDAFWRSVGSGWLYEQAGGRPRWHWLSEATTAEVRRGLGPRAMLTVYPGDPAAPPDLAPNEYLRVQAAVPDPDGVVHLRGHQWGPDHEYRVARADVVAAVAAFAAECGVGELAVREPEFLGMEPDPAWHDGAVVADVEPILAAVLAGTFWCRLELRNEFFVHIGPDAAWLGTGTACPAAAAAFRATPEQSPLATGHDLIVEYRTAEDVFWAEMADATVVEEQWARGAVRVHDLAVEPLESVRANLIPRSVVRVHRPGKPVETAAVPDRDGTIRLRHVR